MAELPWLGLTVLGLVTAHLVAHFVVHRQIVLESLAATGEVAPWMWGALVTPELIVCFLAGWRLRSWTGVVMYAGIGALVRDVVHLGLWAASEPGHPLLTTQPPGRLALAMGAVALSYLVAFGLASHSAREDERLGHRGTRPPAKEDERRPPTSPARAA